jgi:phosphopantothenoylcysteine decarboxylase/phosphopantothenate--cysteine ligase
MQGKHIVLGVTGGIAVYKAAALASKLTQAGAFVHVIMTDGATRFVTPLTFQALTRQRIYTDTFQEENPHAISHIQLADEADLFLVVPASANTISKMANGIADNMLLTTWLATTAPTIIAPAMNGHMLTHPSIQTNMKKLEELGVSFVESGTGQLACGYVGKGRLAEPEQIYEAVEQFFQSKLLLSGTRFLITAGGTREPIDPVRYIGNHSSGKMGHALALVAAQLGATVQLVTTANNAPTNPLIITTKVETALEMYDAVMELATQSDVIIKSAAVADYRPVVQATQKIKKTDSTLTIELVKNPDILATLGANKGQSLLIGFAAETERLDQHAQAKLQQKNCDLIVANDVSASGAGFGIDTNIVSLFDRNGDVTRLPMMSKRDVALQIMQWIIDKRGRL